MKFMKTFNLKEKFTKLNKVKVFGICAATILATAVIAPVVVNTVNQNTPQAPQRYMYNGEYFENKESLFESAKAEAEVTTKTTRSRDQWSVEFNGRTLNFNSIKDLNAFVAKNIITHQAASSIVIESGINGEIATKDYADLNLNPLNSWDTIDIYRGKDNAFYASETEAKDSYLNIHDAYLFDNIFFRTKEELGAYLYKFYDQIETKNDNIVIVAPNKGISQPINLNKLSELNTKNYIEQFVRANSKEYIELETTENNDIAFKYYDRESVNGNMGNILTDFTDVSYVNVQSNQGKPNFVVDADLADEHDLYGPYYTKSSTTLKKITDPGMWRKIEGKDQSFVDNQLQTQLFSAFLDELIGEDTSDSEWKYPFNFGNKNDPDDKYRNTIKTYFEDLKINYPNVYKSVNDLNNHMKNGKRYSSFYKLPILFIHTLEQIVFYSLDQNIVEKTRDFYIFVADYYDACIRTIIPPVFLRNTRNPDKAFSLTDILSFRKYNLDLNVDIETYMDTITDQYAPLLKAADYYSKTVYMTKLSGSLFSFNLIFIGKLWNIDYSASSEEEELGFEKIWNINISKDRAEVTKSLTDICTSNGLEPNQDIINEFLARYVMPKALAVANINSSIEKDIEFIYSADYNSALPNKTQFSESSFFYSLSAYYTGLFANLIRINNNFINHQILGLLKMAIETKGYVDPIYFTLVYSLWLVQQLTNIIFAIAYITLEIFVACTQALYGYSQLVWGYVVVSSHLLMIMSEWKGIDKAYNFLEKSLSIVKDFSSLLDDFKEVSKVFTAILKIAGPFFKFLPLVSIGLTILTNIVSTSEYSYVFESEDAKYIWNGGKERSWFFGLIPETVTDINSMRIQTPYQVTEQHIISGKYYNGVIYDFDDKLKKDQLEDILDGRFESDSLRTVYSFKPDLVISMYKPSIDVFDEIGSFKNLDDGDDGLLDNIYNKLLSSGNPGSDPADSYLTRNVYSYGNGYTFDKNSSHDINIKKIVNEILATKVTTIPTLDKGYPITSDGMGDDNSVPVYKLPNTSWTGGGGLVENTTDTKYIILDSNRVAGETVPSEKVMVDTIKGIFYETFEVESKKIIKSDQYKYGKFSDYVTNINQFNVYEAFLDTGYSKIFIDQSDAFSWILNQLKFTVYDIMTTTEQYTYNGMLFKSLDKYLEWVLENAEEI